MTTPTQATSGALCTFRVAGHRYGLDVARVQEVLRSAPLSPLPLAPAPIAGLVHLRGQIVTAVDLRRVLGEAAASSDARPHVVVFDGASPVSLLVDAVGDVVDVRSRTFEPRPDTLRASLRELVPAVLPTDDGLLLLLDLDPVLARAFAADGAAARSPASEE